MKKFSIVIIFSFLFFIFLTSNSFASWSFNISDENDDGTYLLQFLSEDGPIVVNNFTLGFSYDTVELSFIELSFDPSSFGYASMGDAGTGADGEITNVSALTLSGASLADGTLLATFSFDILSPQDLPQDNQPDLIFQDIPTDMCGGSFYDTLTILSLADLSEDGHLTYGDFVDKNVVPIPSAILLLGGGLLGMLGIRRKMNK